MAAKGKNVSTGKEASMNAAPTAAPAKAGRVKAFLVAYVAVAIAAICLCGAAFMNMPANVGRELTGDELAQIKQDNSPLIDFALLSPNAHFPREDDILKITVHHMAGDLSLEEVGDQFSDRDRRASSNYGIDSDGAIGLFVEEKNRAWTSSNRENDAQAVTIEVANDETEGAWHVSDAALAALVDLIVDICERNGIHELTYTGDASGTLTTHDMFNDRTECPGPYLKSLMPEIAAEVNARLAA